MRESRVRAGSAAVKSRLPGLDWALNPYRGCGHGCKYCYSPDVLREERWKDWGQWVDVRENVPVLLSKQRKSLRGTVGLGTVTDPYQPAERGAMVTRYCLEQLARCDCTVSVHTKSDLILRDLEILKRMKDVEVGFTITTTDEALARRLEPGAPSPQRRLKALAGLSDAGIRTWVFLGPVIPGLNDTRVSLESVIVGAEASGAGKVLYDRLRLKPVVKERLGKLLGDDCGKTYELAGSGRWCRGTYGLIEALCLEKGMECEPAF